MLKPLFLFFGLAYTASAFTIPLNVKETPNLSDNVWEESGLFEGDIKNINPMDLFSRNGLVNETYYWPEGIVPFEIDEKDFSKY